MTASGFIGVDVGTQGLSAVYVDDSINVVARAEAEYSMAHGLPRGCFEQSPADWESALIRAVRDLIAQCKSPLLPRAIGIVGQMHAEVLVDRDGSPCCPARLWCDCRNEAESQELTAHLGIKMPKRMTAVRWLWTLRHRPEIAKRSVCITTAAGWLAFRLTGLHRLGVGDASGMFPISASPVGSAGDAESGGTCDFDKDRLAQFDRLAHASLASLATDASSGAAEWNLRDMLPAVCVAGESSGSLTKEAAQLLGLSPGVPVAPAEGDQPATLAGSRIGSPGTVSMSFGTSVCCNTVADRPFHGVHQAVDHFRAANGTAIHMVCLTNGTQFMNRVAELFGSAHAKSNDGQLFAHLLSEAAIAAPDCGGLIALPFMEDEPALGISQGGTAMLLGLESGNATTAEIVKAALLSTVYNLKFGCEPLLEQGMARDQIVMTGGLTKTPRFAQVLADVFAVPVRLRESADEGAACGAALLAKFRWLATDRSLPDWGRFLMDHDSDRADVYQPRAAWVPQYAEGYARHRKLLALVPALQSARNG